MSSIDERPKGQNQSQMTVEAALPSRFARALAFLAILVAGLCGGLIGYAVTDLQVSGDGGVAAGIGGVVGALGAATGVAVVSVLALRAMTEWHTLEERERALQRKRDTRSNPQR